jgi:hypothetical protein
MAGCLLAVAVYAADVRMSVEPAMISLLDRAVLKIEFIDTKGDAIDIPQVEGLKVQYQGQSSETRIVNFKSTSKVIHNYIITPTKVGDFTIGPVTCNYRGGQKEVSAQLRVIKPKDDKEAQQISEVLYSRITTDRISPYVHEPFDLEVKIYIRDGVQIDGNFSLRGGIPESGMDGDLQWEVIGRERADVEGTIFNVYTLRTTAETLTAGVFTFRPEVQVNVVVPSQRRRPYGFDDPFFGDFFGRQETRPIVLDCNTLEVHVQSVPMEGRPGSYTGGVGLFDFSVETGPKQVKAGEPVTVKMRVFGEGNISQIIPPTLEVSHELKLYEVRTLPTETPGEVLFEQVVIPKSDNVVEIPAISFSYFNTKTADFRTLTRGPFPITVQASANQSAQVIASIPSTIQPKTEILGRDIVYLKPTPSVWKKTSRPLWFETVPFYIALTFPAILLLLVAGVTARRNALTADVARARRQEAPKAARNHIQRAERAMHKNDEGTFYEAMWNALTGYFGHRLNLAPGEVSLPVVLDRIPQEKTAIEELFNTIEQRRYGFHADSGKEKGEMKTLLRRLTTTLKKCERIKL